MLLPFRPLKAILFLLIGLAMALIDFSYSWGNHLSVSIKIHYFLMAFLALIGISLAENVKSVLGMFTFLLQGSFILLVLSFRYGLLVFIVSLIILSTASFLGFNIHSQEKNDS